MGRSRRSRGSWVALFMSVMLTACGTEDGAETEVAERDSREVPRGPLGAREVSCRGASIDPTDAIARLSSVAGAGDSEAAIHGLEALAGEHPSSATVRVRLGEVLLASQPPEPERAQRWFDLGLARHDQGCTLPTAEHWMALEGAAMSRMMQDDYRGAIRFMDSALVLWPGARHTRYNLACALCQVGEVDRCAEELQIVLQPMAEPQFLEERAYPIAHYRDAAERDPDLEPLRRDRTRFEAILVATE